MQTKWQVCAGERRGFVQLQEAGLLEALGWKFRPFEETLRDSVESFRAAGVLD